MYFIESLVTLTDPAVEGSQAPEWAQRGSGGRGPSGERTQPAGAAGPWETSGQEGAAVQLEQAAAAAQPSPLRRWGGGRIEAGDLRVEWAGT